jgi:acyl-CoA synthetase (AMP-forming)/AMP-acid ligase II
MHPCKYRFKQLCNLLSIHSFTHCFYAHLCFCYAISPHPFAFSDFEQLGIQWFADGTLNACVNAVDRHAAAQPDRIALHYVADAPSDGYSVTYGQLQEGVSQVCHWLSGQSYLTPGSVVTLYMPMVPEAVMVMLACTRLGLIHNVVFGGFSAAALRERILDTRSALIVTGDVGCRGGKQIPLLQTALEATKGLFKDETKESFVHRVLVFERSRVSDVGLVALKHHYPQPYVSFWRESICTQPTFYASYYKAPAETPLFTLYTSGSTGKPKGIVHTTGGYLLYAMMTLRYVFGIDFRQPGTFVLMILNPSTKFTNFNNIACRCQLFCGFYSFLQFELESNLYLWSSRCGLWMYGRYWMDYGAFVRRVCAAADWRLNGTF